MGPQPGFESLRGRYRPSRRLKARKGWGGEACAERCGLTYLGARPSQASKVKE